jgi:mono/diheme cytochrome c family protein
MMGQEESRSFLKKRTKKLLGFCGSGAQAGVRHVAGVFCFFFLKRKGLLFLLSCVPAEHALADAATVNTSKVLGSTGAQVYQHVCQGCHMPGGRGAVGAGAFPALANDPKLAVSGYPVTMVLNGHGGMPWFNGLLTPDQIAAVVNYVRTNFGNHYEDAVTPAFVAAAAGPPPVMER